MPGPAPKPQRRRRNKPASYGDATPVTAPAARLCDKDRDLGIDDPHPLIASLWNTVQHSCEAAFYSEADWARLRLELWYANTAMASGRPSAGAWETVQHGLSEMLISPATKRRCGIEVRPSVDEDPEAVAMIGRYRQALKPV